MARMLTQDYNSKRERIKMNAAVLFAHKGYYGTSIIDIAKACRTVKSRLYYYFPSKAQLFYEIIKDHAEFMVASLLPIFEGSSLDAKTQLERYAQTLLRMNVENRDQHKIVLNTLDVPDAPSALEPQQFREINMLLRRTVEALYPALLTLNPKLQAERHLLLPTAMMFTGMINGCQAWRDGAVEIQIDGLAQHLCGIFIDGYSA